ncbi:MAG: lysophospholipid acyltransferase family protein [Myxococcota bacterium]
MTPTDLPPSEAAPPEELGATEAGTAALGCDPFAEDDGPDPFLERLARLEHRVAAAPAPKRPRAVPGLRAEPPPEAPQRVQQHWTTRPLAPPRTEPTRRRWATTPALSELDVPEPSSWVDRLPGDEERTRLSALAHLVEGDAPYDRFGYSPATTRVAFPFFHALYRLWFRVHSEGHEHLPLEGPAVLAGNHGGLLPFDAAMGIVDIALHTDPPRLLRAVVDRWAGRLPWINVFYARVGQVVGTRENFSDLLDDGQLVLVFPEGIEGVRKTVTQRYRLQSFRVGFVEEALRARAPIIPTAFIGSDDQAPILYDVKPLARRLGLPVAPITPTFPWLGPLGLIPYPVSYRIVYGEPLRFHERFGPEGADHPQLVRYLANRVRRTVQQMIDRRRS